MALLPAGDKEFTMETREASPAHMLIKIESFSLLSTYGIRKYESREFVAGDYKWRLIIYPDGDERENELRDHVSAYLSVAGTSSLTVGWEVNAVFSIFLYNQIAHNYLCFRGITRRFHAMNSKWGFPKLISRKILTDPSNGYLVDDNCVFGAEVFVVKSQRVIEHVSVLKVTDPHKRNWKIPQFSKLKGVWTSEEFCTGGYRWKIKLYPNGNGRGECHSISIFKECVDSKSFAPHEKVEANVCIRIKNKLRDTHRSKNFSHWFTSSEFEWGFAQFISIADMSDPDQGFVIDDCCFLEIEITVRAVVSDAPESAGDLSLSFSKLCL